MCYNGPVNWEKESIIANDNCEYVGRNETSGLVSREKARIFYSVLGAQDVAEKMARYFNQSLGVIEKCDDDRVECIVEPDGWIN